MSFESTTISPAARAVPEARFNLVGMTSGPRSADEQARIDLDATARALPDSLFADHPEVIQATERHTAAQRRHERLCNAARKTEKMLGMLQHLEDELQAAQAQLRFAAIDDFLDGDIDFTVSVELLERVAVLQQRIQVANLARLDVQKSPVELREFKELAVQAETDLRNLLFKLKRQHVHAQNHGSV